MKHFELTEIVETFGVDSPITAAATRYFKLHPTRSFGVAPESEDYWCTDSDGSVWTPLAAISPRVESELFWAHGSFYEICWNDGDVEAVFRDGQLIFSGHDEVSHPINWLASRIRTDTLIQDIEAAYRLGLNPLPEIRRILGIYTIVNFGITGGVHFSADEHRDTLVFYFNDDSGSVSWRYLPAKESYKKVVSEEISSQQ
jgi:hypothetical protein